MRLVLFTLTMLGCCAAADATVYKWVDANGVVHYSDQPQPGAEKVNVDQPQTYRGADATSAGNSSAAAAANSDSDSGEGSCEMASPENEEVLMNTSSVSGRLRLNLHLNPGDHIAVTLDGMRYDAGGDSSGAFTLTQVYRGTHTLSATVESSDGETRCQTATITFYVRQPSTQSPTTPVHPK